MRRVAGGFTTTQRNASGPPQPGHAKPSTRNTRSNRSLQLGRSPASWISPTEAVLDPQRLKGLLDALEARGMGALVRRAGSGEGS